MAFIRLPVYLFAATLMAFAVGGPSFAADEEGDAEAPAEAEVKDILAGLDNPTGIAVQPETGHVFVADSGAGRVVKFDPAAKKQDVVAAIDGYSLDVYGKGPMYNIGPLGLAFMGQNTLVVGDGSQKDGEEVVRVYDLSGGKALKAEDSKYTLGPIAAGDDSEKGEGNFYGVAASNTAIYITCNGDDTKGWIARSLVEGGKPGDLLPFIATKKLLEDTDAPVGITLNQNGQIVVGQMGEINKPKDSLLTVYDPESGELMIRAETGLFDIAGLAFSPKTGKLYCVDYAWMDSKEGGVFRLDVDEDARQVTAEKIASLDKPTSLAFGADGSLYVALIGTAEEGDTRKPGKLVKIVGEY
ncbi:MAG: hypothetical protein AB7O62_19555 [Pirellulales bacterium]